MAASLEQFIAGLTASGLMTPAELAALQASLTAEKQPKETPQLAQDLVRQGKLTKYQASEIYNGRTKGLVLGDYVVLDRIGAGGMGQVFRAQHRRMKRLVAIKQLPAATTKDPQAVKRFQREVEAAARLSHPNIVAAHDAREERGVHYLVMECVEGSDLAEIVKKQGALPLAQALDCVLQAARGLEHAHTEGVVHRDIKPANLLLDKKGTVKILDMGLARFDTLAGGDEGLTGTGNIMGTVDFMSPEQAEDTKHADARADIYSLGCTLWYLLTAEKLYEVGTVMKKLLAHREMPIPSLTSARPDVPPAVDAVFRRMVAKRPEERYQTMTEVIAALEAARHGRGGLLAEGSQVLPDPEASDPGLASFFKSLGDGTGTAVGAATVQKPAARGAVPDDTSSRQIDSLTRPPRVSPLASGSRNPTGINLGWAMLQLRTSRGAQVIAAAAACLLLAGGYLLYSVIIKVETPHGTLVIDCNVPGAEIFVDEQKKTTIAIPGDPQKVAVEVQPGQHKLKVTKGGFQTHTETFTLTSNKSKSIKVSLQLSAEPAASLANMTPPRLRAPFTFAEAKERQQNWANFLGTTVGATNSLGVKMVLIPPGEFLMGSTDEQVATAFKVAEEVKADQITKDRIQQGERPQHRVVITKPFLMGVTEITIGQFKKFSATGYQTEAEKAAIAAKASQPPPATPGQVQTGSSTPIPTYLSPGYIVYDNSPAAAITWNDAVAYCKWLSEQEKATYRLPTEAEWEYACRAGATTQYSFADDVALLEQHGWYNQNAGNKSHPVGTRWANDFGLHDMHGNLYEWCHDFYAEKWYEQSPTDDPQGPSSGSYRVMRSGAAYSNASACRSATRFRSMPSSRTFYEGFRIVRVLEGRKNELQSQIANLKSQMPNSKLPAPLPAKAPFDAKAARAHQEAWAGHLGVSVEISNSAGGRCRLIPPGEFIMGSTQQEMEFWQKQEPKPKTREGMVAEVPQHQVRITKPFYAGIHEVTIREFREFARATGFKPGGPGFKLVGGAWTAHADCTWENPGWQPDPEEPVTCIGLADAQAFCQWLSRKEQRSWRLPTEAEWEYMARAGSTTAFWNGDELTPQMARTSNVVPGLAKVGSFPANPLGLFDIHGNVWERTGDWFDAKAYQRGPLDDPQGPTKGTLSVDRGGGWYHGIHHARSANRGFSDPNNRVSDKGFRIVSDITAAPPAIDRR